MPRFSLPLPTGPTTRRATTRETQVRARPRKHAALTILYPRSPYARQRHDALLCCHAHAPHCCLPLLPHHLCHSAATALFRTATGTACCVYADGGVTLLLPRCCYLAALASNTPTKQNKANSQAAPYLQAPATVSSATATSSSSFAVTASTAPVARSRRLHHHVHRPHRQRHRLRHFHLRRQPACLLPDRMPSSTSPPFPTGPCPQGESGTTPLYGLYYRGGQKRFTSKKLKTPPKKHASVSLPS